MHPCHESLDIFHIDMYVTMVENLVYYDDDNYLINLGTCIIVSRGHARITIIVVSGIIVIKNNFFFSTSTSHSSFFFVMNLLSEKTWVRNLTLFLLIFLLAFKMST